MDTWAKEKERIAIEDAVEALINRWRREAAERSGDDPVRTDWAPFTTAEIARARADVLRSRAELARVRDAALDEAAAARIRRTADSIRDRAANTGAATPTGSGTRTATASLARTEVRRRRPAPSSPPGANLSAILGHIGVTSPQARQLLVEWVGLAKPGDETRCGDLEITATTDGVEVRRPHRGGRDTVSRINTPLAGSRRNRR
jgi:hypothetical protein